MSEPKEDEFAPESYKDAARRSLEAGIADESAAYEAAIEGDAPEPEKADDSKPSE